MRKENGRLHKTVFCSTINESSDGDSVVDLFLLSDVRYNSNSKGNKWLSLTLEDKTGSVPAKIWGENIAMEYEGYRGHIVCLKGNVSFYFGRPDLAIEKMWLPDESTFDVNDVLRTLDPEKEKACRGNIERMIDFISDMELKKYVSYALDESALEQMARMPVGIKGHHSYRGGLLEHTEEVARTVYYMLRGNEKFRSLQIDSGIALAGALLHDIPRSFSFQEEGYIFRQSMYARLMCDAKASYVFLERVKEECPVNERTYAQLVHVIEASHGEIEPKTMEAIVVRNSNVLSAELAVFEDEVARHELLYGSGGIFYSKKLGHEIFCPERS